MQLKAVIFAGLTGDLNHLHLHKNQDYQPACSGCVEEVTARDWS